MERTGSTFERQNYGHHIVTKQQDRSGLSGVCSRVITNRRYEMTHITVIMWTNRYCWHLMVLNLPNYTGIKLIPFAQTSFNKVPESQEMPFKGTKMLLYSPFYFPHASQAVRGQSDIFFQIYSATRKSWKLFFNYF